MKIRPMGTELFHADGQRGVTKLIVGVHNFAKGPKTVGEKMKKERACKEGRRCTARGGRDLHLIRIYCPRKKGRKTKRKKRNRKYMGDSFLRQFGTWKLECFSSAE